MRTLFSNIQIYHCLVIIFLLNFSCIENKEENLAINKESNIALTDTINSSFESQKVFRSHKELKGFGKYDNYSGTVVDQGLPEYKYALEVIHNQDEFMVLFEKIVSTDSKYVKYQLLDTISIEKTEPNLFIASGTCRINEKDDGKVFALIKQDTTRTSEPEFFTNPIKVWTLNLMTLKIELLEEYNHVDCYNEGYGI